MVLADIKLVDIYKPDMILAIRDIPEDFKWYSFYKDHNLKGFTYAITYKGIVIKYGCSYVKWDHRKLKKKTNPKSKPSSNYGDRLIRQIRNLPGRIKIHKTDWYKQGYGFLPSSKNGREIVEPILELQKQLGIQINQNDIYIHIWNITDVESTKYFFPKDDKGNKARAEYFEGLMVDQYKRDNKDTTPVGNIQDPSTRNHAYTKPKIAKEVGEMIFGT